MVLTQTQGSLVLLLPPDPLSHQWFPPDPVLGSHHGALNSLAITPEDLGGLREAQCFRFSKRTYCGVHL